MFFLFCFFFFVFSLEKTLKTIKTIKTLKTTPKRKSNQKKRLLTIGLEPITYKVQILSLPCLPISPSERTPYLQGKYSLFLAIFRITFVPARVDCFTL